MFSKFYLILIVYIFLKLLTLTKSQKHPLSVFTDKNKKILNVDKFENQNFTLIDFVEYPKNNEKKQIDDRIDNEELPSQVFKLEIQKLNIEPEIKQKANKKIRKDKKAISNQLIKSIKSRLYTDADYYITELGINSLRTQLLIRNFYLDNNHNFTMLYDYARNSENSKICFNILKELWNQLNNEENINIYNLYSIYELFEKKLLTVMKIDKIYIDYINELIDTIIIPKIQYETIKNLNNILLNNDEDEFYKLTMIIHATNETFFDYIIGNVINKIYYELRFRNLIQIMWKLQFLTQKASALKYIFWNLQKNNMFNNGQSTILIAYYLKLLIQLPNFLNLKQLQINEINNCIDNLPKILKNLYFSKYIYLKNLAKQDYIGVSSVYDKWKHNVDALRKYNCNDNKTAWIPIIINESIFKFKSKLYKNEYLYVGNDKAFTGHWRKVFTWQAKDDYDGIYEKNLLWNVKFTNNVIILTNLYYNEPLCSNLGYVITTNIMRETKYSWIVEN